MHRNRPKISRRTVEKQQNRPKKQSQNGRETVEYPMETPRTSAVRLLPKRSLAWTKSMLSTPATAMAAPLPLTPTSAGEISPYLTSSGIGLEEMSCGK